MDETSTEPRRRTEAEVRSWVDGGKSAMHPWKHSVEAASTDAYWQGYETCLDQLANFLLLPDEERL